MKSITIDCSRIGQVEFFKLLKANKDDTCVVITDIGTTMHINIIKAALDGKLYMRSMDIDEEFEFTSTIVITYNDVPNALADRMWKIGNIFVSPSK